MAVHGCPVEIAVDQISKSDNQVLAEQQYGYSSLSEAGLGVGDSSKKCTTQCDSTAKQNIHSYTSLEPW